MSSGLMSATATAFVNVSLKTIVSQLTTITPLS